MPIRLLGNSSRIEQPFVRRSPSQRGATLVLIAFFAVSLAVATGIVADTGMMYYQHTRMQVASDAAALAGAHGLLTSHFEATREAQALAEANGFALDPGAVTFPPGKRCRVEIVGKEPLLLGKLLKMDTADIGAASTAELLSVSQQPGPRPFGVPDTDFVLGHCTNPGREYVLKTGAGAALHGNFQPLALDGPGTEDYVKAILNGARSSVSIGDVVDTKPGNMAGPTVDSLNQLIASDQTSYDEAVAHPDQTPRVIEVPLIASRAFELARGRSVVRVTGLARFYIMYATRQGWVYGRFIDNVTAKTLSGTVFQSAVKLVE